MDGPHTVGLPRIGSVNTNYNEGCGGETTLVCYMLRVEFGL